MAARSHAKNAMGVSRLQKEYKMIASNPPPNILARPDDSLFDCYFVFDGPVATPFEGGRYLGHLRFPQDYPLSPPTVSIITPNGRFKCNTPLCMSNTDFHKREWVPTWSIATILLGFVSFFVETGTPTHGSIDDSTEGALRRFAEQSHKFNDSNVKFRKIFAEFVGKGIAEPLTAVATAAAAVSQPLTCSLPPQPTLRLPQHVRTASTEPKSPAPLPRHPGGALGAGAAPGGVAAAPFDHHHAAAALVAGGAPDSPASPRRETTLSWLWQAMVKYGVVVGIFAFSAQIYRSVLDRLS